jgi:two-component system response regulator ResD
VAPRILVVDDEPIVREVLTRYLEKDGFEVDAAADGEAAIDLFASRRPDLILLDLMLPKVDGFEVFSYIRSGSTVPVIMITARDKETDRIAGLDMGADDYVSKPFSPGEVVARVRAVLRRSDADGERRDLTYGDLVIEGDARRVSVSDRELTLTPKEFDLLYFLASNPGKVFTRLDLLDELWDFAFHGDPSTVTVHIRRLREKIEADASDPRHIVTVWGAGYRFDP